MSSLNPKPFALPGKSSSLRRFNCDESKEQSKSQTLPNTMPVFSGDILKQRLEAMQSKKLQMPVKKDQHHMSSGPAAVPLIDRNELMKRRDSMNRTPAPPTPDAKQKNDRTPEFLRKKLKPTANLPKNHEQENEGNADMDIDGEAKTEETKKSFRNSRLLFESISAAPKVTPKPAPKPAPRPKPDKNSFKDKTEQPGFDGSKTSEEASSGNDSILQEDDGKDSLCNVLPENKKLEVAGELDLSEKCNEPLNHHGKMFQLEGQSDMDEKSREALNQLDGILDLEDQNEVVKEVIQKPNIAIPEAPVGLELWMNYFVKNSTKLLKLDEPDVTDVPPPVHRGSRPAVTDRKGVNTAAASSMYYFQFDYLRYFIFMRVISMKCVSKN